MENDVTESPMLENIRILVLNNCGVTWELVYTCHFEAFLISADHIKS
jgi:tubulin-specific chaperone E